MRPGPRPQYLKQLISNVPTSFGVSSTVTVLPPAGTPAFSPSAVSRNPFVPTTETTFDGPRSPTRTSLRLGEKA